MEHELDSLLDKLNHEIGNIKQNIKSLKNKCNILSESIQKAKDDKLMYKKQ